MPSPTRIDKIEAKLDKLVGVVDALASSVVAHDYQIESLIKIAEHQSRELDKLRESIAALERQWQAYINTLPRQ